STDEPTWGGGGFTTGTAENLFSSNWQSEFKHTGIFGEITYHLSDTFDITGGVRWSSNETEFDQTLGGLWQCSTFDTTVPSTCDANNENVFPRVKSDDDATTFLITPRWHISDSTMLYARAAQGFRPGGPNSLAPSAIAAGAEVVYDSDSLTNYEIGVKTLLADNRVLIDLAAFYIDWEDIQIRQISGGFAYTGNGGKASSEGIELAVTARPTDNLSISFNLGTLDAKLEEDAPGIGVGAVTGDKLPNAPDLTHGGTINYDFPDFNGYTVGIGGSWRHVDDRLGDLGAAERVVLESYDTYNLHASLSNDRFVLRAYAKNLTDERGIDSVSPYFSNAIISRPRTVGLSLTMSY
ncbi:MAG: TonB-dependent receptor, partial [Gammaproteobacteria bacterium]